MIEPWSFRRSSLDSLSRKIPAKAVRGRCVPHVNRSSKVIQHLLPPPSSGVVCVPGALGIETGGGNQRDCLWLDVIRLVFPLLRLL